jgi:co-chaperonin GroES (HSP10)
MRLSSTGDIKPLKDMVLVSIVTKEYKDDELVLEDKDAEKSGDQAKMYFGEVLSMGPDATSKEHCPGLKDKDTVLFSQFAGHHVSTREDKFVLFGYDAN